MERYPVITNGNKNHQLTKSLTRFSYAIEIKHKGCSLGYLNGTQNVDDGVCLKVANFDSDKKLIKRFMDVRSANCSIAGTKRMMKGCTLIYFFNTDNIYSLKEMHYDINDIKFEVVRYEKNN